MLELSFTPYTFDIETTDLAGSAEVIGWTLYDVQHGTYCQEFRALNQTPDVLDEDLAPVCENSLLHMLSVHLQALRGDYKESLRLVTYNGESYRGGFDMPFLRRRYIENKLQDRWPFKGLRHLDLLPIVQPAEEPS